MKKVCQVCQVCQSAKYQKKIKKIEKSTIYGDSYFQVSNGTLAHLAHFSKNNSYHSLDTNSGNSFSLRLKKEDTTLLLC